MIRKSGYRFSEEVMLKQNWFQHWRLGMRRSYLLGAGLAIAVAGMTNSAFAQSEIKIGEINSYSAQPAFTEPYRKGWQRRRRDQRQEARGCLQG
jgi:hypothetical protein